jgi:hypothetical protein
MSTPDFSVPTPDLRIIHTAHIHPHEEHDSQRATPLVEKLRVAQFLTNPPIVAPMPNGEFVVLDGANRYHCLCQLGYEHILAQVAPYETGFVQLHVWQHIISDWDTQTWLSAITKLSHLSIHQGWQSHALAHIVFKDGSVTAIQANSQDLDTRNTLLRQFVGVYQRHARLDRTTLNDLPEIWDMYPNAIAVVQFPHYQPNDIILAAQHQAFLPPGISRHVVHGRALQVNYPLAELHDKTVSLEAKNERLKVWLRDRFAQRAVRFYAESTYQFSE